MNALITGGTGFIGSHVANELLDKGHAVRLFSRKKNIPDQFKGRNIEAFQGDLQDAPSLINALDSVDVFYHIGEIKNRSKAAAERNVMLLKEMLPHLKSKNIRRIVFVSSITVSGIPSTVPANEDTPQELILNDHYTAYKRTCEELIRNASQDVEYVIIRPAPVYGPGSRYLGRFVDILEKLGPIGVPFAGNAQNLAPLIHVKDLAKAIAIAGSAPSAPGQTFILTDGLRHTWLEFLHAVSEGLGKKLRVIPVPPLLLQIAALPVDLFSLFLGISIDPVNYIKYFSRDIHFENTKAKKLLDWQPQYSLSEGIADMLHYYRAH